MSFQKKITTLFLSLFTLLLTAQTIPANRIYNWKNAGLENPLPAYSTLFNMQVQGADITGNRPCDALFLATINQCTVTGQSYTIMFPAGLYTYTNTIQLKSNVKLEGVGVNTHLIFKNAVTCINVQGRNTSGTKFFCNAIITNLNKFNNQTQFDIYPNPAVNCLKIKNINSSITEKNISNLIGTVISKPLVSETIDLSSLASGVYFFTLKSNKEIVYSQKIIVIK